MDQLEIPEGGPREAYHIWVERDVTIMGYGWEVYRFYPVFARRPDAAGFLRRHSLSDVFRQAQIRGEYRDVMPEAREAMRESANFDDGTSALLKWKIGLDHHQQAHSV